MTDDSRSIDTEALGGDRARGEAARGGMDSDRLRAAHGLIQPG